ncbi:MAG: AMP-binding protein [Silicimonas sp.]|nr:AMP-binding protein [Silicimonas sp.]
MAESVFLSGQLHRCPDRFNAAEYCLGADVDGETSAFIAVDPSRGVTETWSFAQTRERVLRAAGAYRAAGVRPGDRVALLLGDVPDFPMAYFGAMAAGAVATPLSSQLSPGEIAGILEAIEAKAIVGGDAQTLSREDLRSGEVSGFEPRSAEDPALLVFTSGSSGRPKGVLHAGRAFWARRSMHAGWHGIRAGDRVMHAGAFNWTFTLGVGLADTWSVGATAILNAGARSPEVWPELARIHQPTVFAGAPAVFRRILKYGDGLSAGFASLRHAVTAGEALAPAAAAAWREKTGKPILEALGMSEVSTYVSTPPDRKAAPGVAGWPQPGRKVAVLNDAGTPVPRGEVGALAVHQTDPGLMLGYWRDEAATRAAYAGEWFVTGDMVRMDDSGAISYAGRRDDQMNAQGFRVDPGEVEAAMMSCPGVAECGVTELELEPGLSIIAAWVVPGEGASLERAAILAHLRTRIATYKLPREVFLSESLPHSANGKLLRRKLSELPRDRL